MLASGKTKTTKILKGEERFIRIQGSPDLTAEDLIGDIPPEQINAGDFTVGLIEGVECDNLNAATEAMIDATPISLLTAGATVPRGDFVGIPALQEELNVCLTLVDPTLSAQFYRTSNPGTTAWDTTTFF